MPDETAYRRAMEDVGRQLGAFADAFGTGSEAVAQDLVRVRIDAGMRVAEVEILDSAMPADSRARLATAFAEAANQAMANLIEQAGRALSRDDAPPG